MTDWTRVVRPAKDNRLAFHPTNLYLTLSKIQLRSKLLTLSKIQLRSKLEVSGCLIGNPKYFPKFGVELNPKVLHKDSFFSLSILNFFTYDKSLTKHYSHYYFEKIIEYSKSNIFFFHMYCSFYHEFN